MNSEQEYYSSLIERLRQLPEETEWLEYKVNNYEPELIGEYISALSNSATICEKEKAYILWGLMIKLTRLKEQVFPRKEQKKAMRKSRIGWLTD